MMLHRRRSPVTFTAGRDPHVLVLLLAVGALCAVPRPCWGQDESPPAITGGVWQLEAGDEEFLWEFTLGSNGVLNCLVHSVRGRVKVTETPCRAATYADGEVEVSMGSGVRLVGTIRSEGILDAQLRYPDGTSADVELRLRSRERYPALYARLAEAEASYHYHAPPGRPGGWPTANAHEVGISPEALKELVSDIIAGKAGVLHSLLVARHGTLVLEEYFHGYRSDDLHPLRSCTKSVSSLLVGLAIESGAIADENVRVRDFFPGPDYQAALGDGWDGLTLRHLLTMTMTLDWSPSEAADLHGTGPAFFRRVLSHSVSGNPGHDWDYVSANVDLLAGILREATGLHAEEFARAVLFEPLAIPHWDWEGLKTDGYNLMDGSLELRPRDMAKLGQLVLAGGVWEGTRLLAEDWIERSTAWIVDTGEAFEGYGYLWWKTAVAGSGGDRLDVTVANGWGSQFIFVIPALDLVLVTTGGNDYNGKHLAVTRLLMRLIRSGVVGLPAD